MTFCDKCSAAAAVSVLSPYTGLTLSFCGHHYAERRLDLTSKGFSLAFTVSDGKPIDYRFLASV